MKATLERIGAELIIDMVEDKCDGFKVISLVDLDNVYVRDYSPPRVYMTGENIELDFDFNNRKAANEFTLEIRKLLKEYYIEKSKIKKVMI